MADEITVSVLLKMAKGQIELKREVRNYTLDMAGDAYDAEVVTATTAANGIALSIATAVGTGGYAWFRNLDSTNFVEIGVLESGTFAPTVKLKAGEFCLFRLATDAIYIKGDTASCLLEYIVIED